METPISEYKRTDPDNFQFGREIRGGVFEFKEFDRNVYPHRYKDLKNMSYERAHKALAEYWDTPDRWVQMEINLADYSEPEIENHVSAYYDNLDNLKEIYGDDWMFIAAECIFEQESGLY